MTRSTRLGACGIQGMLRLEKTLLKSRSKRAALRTGTRAALVFRFVDPGGGLTESVVLESGPPDEDPGGRGKPPRPP